MRAILDDPDPLPTGGTILKVIFMLQVQAFGLDGGEDGRPKFTG